MRRQDAGSKKKAERKLCGRKVGAKGEMGTPAHGRDGTSRHSGQGEAGKRPGADERCPGGEILHVPEPHALLPSETPPGKLQSRPQKKAGKRRPYADRRRRKRRSNASPEGVRQKIGPEAAQRLEEHAGRCKNHARCVGYDALARVTDADRHSTSHHNEHDRSFTFKDMASESEALEDPENLCIPQIAA